MGEVTLENVSATRAGGPDRERFEEEHARLGAWVKRMFAARCGGRAEIIEDLSQRTWTGVWRAVSTGRYDPARAAMTTFVYAVAQNVWRQWSKERSRGASGGEAAADDVRACGVEPGHVLAEAELIEAVRACVQGRAGGLNPEEREVLRLIGSGETDRSLADRLGVAPSTAHGRKKAALDKLRVYLAGRFGEGGERDAVSGE